MFLIEDQHFAYLRIQKGNLDNVSRDRAAWTRAYHEDILRQFESFAGYLPATCARFLDIGSGLGGIDILIRREYEKRGQDPEFALLDGVSDPPVMNLHRETFNNMSVAEDFHVKNGANPDRFSFYSPRTIYPGPGVAYDLVVSFGSWCFHLPPQVYLPALCHSGMHAGTVAVLDVRQNKPAWWHDLEDVFELVAVVAEKPKWRRCVFKVRQK